MSKAYCCDRCNNCFNPLMLNGERFIKIGPSYIQDGQTYAENKVLSRYDEMHLCPECTRMWMSFFSGADIVEKKLFDDLQEDYEELLGEEGKNHEEDIFDFGTRVRSAFNGLSGSIRDFARQHRERIRKGETPERESKSEKDGIC